ncbi:uncharacterized protein LOC142044826 [Buteo buteo]|uniref:uncharacterized protein LOC142044826 n=1 Tax=Buteo buteo TaxID=30397 RepID=UPI003EB9A298
MGCGMRGECSAGGTEGPAVLDSSCSGKTADPPLATPTLTGAGVLPTEAAQEEEDDDSSFDSESDCEAPTEASAAVRLPPVYKREAWVQPVAKKSSIGVFPAAAAQVSAPEREELPLKEDASCQTDFRGDRQLQGLKERHIQTECYAEYLKNAIKRKERELTTFRNVQDLLTTSSATAAIPELEDPIQRLQGETARMQATVRQQAKTIEALRKGLRARASSHHGLEDSVTGFQTARTAKEHQRRQRGSESKEVKKLGKTKCRSEALPDEVSKRSAALEEEQARLKMPSADVSDNPDCICGEKEKVPARLPGRDEESCSELTS